MRSSYSRPVNCYNKCDSDQTPRQLYRTIYADTPVASDTTPDADSDSDSEPTWDSESENTEKEDNKEKEEELSWDYTCNSHPPSELQPFQLFMHVPLVCKHILHEGRAVFWSTSTFGVSRFFLSDWSSTHNKAIKSKIHNLEVCMQGKDLSEALVSSSSSRLSSLLALRGEDGGGYRGVPTRDYRRFKKLRTVGFIVFFTEEDIERFFSEDRDFETSEIWRDTSLMQMIQAFRLLGLRREGMRVVFVPHGVERKTFGVKGESVKQKARMKEVSDQATALLLRPAEKRVFDRKGRGMRTSL
jgi:hypothetical protein